MRKCVFTFAYFYVLEPECNLTSFVPEINVEVLEETHLVILFREREIEKRKIAISIHNVNILAVLDMPRNNFNIINGQSFFRLS